MKYRIKDKVKIIRCIDNPYYLNKTGEIIGKVGELNKLRLDYDSRKEIDDFLLEYLGWVYVRDEQLIKIEKGLEIE